MCQVYILEDWVTHIHYSKKLERLSSEAVADSDTIAARH